MAKTTSRRSRPSRTNAAGHELMESLRELYSAVTRGDTSKLTMRTVEIPDPAPYGPKDIKALRQALGVSQGIFAHLLAVSPELVSHWEYGIRQPSPMARRLLDQIRKDPDRFRASLVKRKTA